MTWYDKSNPVTVTHREEYTMEPNKPVDIPEATSDTYTPLQWRILKLMQWGAWTAAFIAMMYVMDS